MRIAAIPHRTIDPRRDSAIFATPRSNSTQLTRETAPPHSAPDDMRLDRCIALIMVALTATAPAVHAQQAADPVMPHAGSWGAEAVVGNGIGANLLHFSSPTAAWLVGLSFSVGRETDALSGFGGAGANQSSWLGSGYARLGRRWWRGERDERIRPLTGLGVLGGLTSNSGVQSWNAGGYGELGASYFYSPHFSIGATGELTAVYARDRYLNVATQRITRWMVGGTLVRVNASVYF
jgi:hypothetical protein